jgi:hypothetical protein
MPSRNKARIVAVFELLVAALLIVGIWVALPARWWPVDVTGTLLGAALLAGGGGLLLDKSWGRLLSVVASWFSLAIGMVTVTVLAFTASYLAGLYGPVGGGGALIVGATAALVLPYLIGLPLLQLTLLRKG